MNMPLFFNTNIDDSNLDNTCARKYFNTKLELGTGMRPAEELLEQQMIDATQSDLREIAGIKSLDVYVLERLVNDLTRGMTPAHKANFKGMQLLYRRIGLMSAYALFVEPLLRRFYESIDIPPEVILTRAPLMVKVKMGRLLKNRQTGELLYREFVPTEATGSSKWKTSWEYSVRPQLSIAAVQQCMRMTIQAAQVMGIGMGYRSALTSNAGVSLAHPYVQAYHNAAKNEWTHLFKPAIEGWVPRPVWEWPGTPVQWIVKCGKDVGLGLFPLSARVAYNHTVLEGWIDHRLHRERVIWSSAESSLTSKTLLSMNFPMNTLSCMPLHEPHCPFLMKCWSDKKEGKEEKEATTSTEVKD